MTNYMYLDMPRGCVDLIYLENLLKGQFERNNYCFIRLNLK